MTVIGALSSFRKRGEMSPHKRASRHLLQTAMDSEHALIVAHAEDKSQENLDNPECDFHGSRW
jgi:hypothetical protein